MAPELKPSVPPTPLSLSGLRGGKNPGSAAWICTVGDPLHSTPWTNFLGCRCLSLAPLSSGEKKEASISQVFHAYPSSSGRDGFYPFPHQLFFFFFFFHSLSSWSTWKTKLPASIQQSGTHWAGDTKAGAQGPNCQTDYTRNLALT